MMLLPTSCNFGPRGVSPQPPMAVSSCCHLPLPWQIHKWIWAPVSHLSLTSACCISEQKGSLLFCNNVMFSSQLFPVQVKGEAELGNSSHICFFSTVSKANSKHPQESRCEMWMMLGQGCWMKTAVSRMCLKYRSTNQLQTHLTLTPLHAPIYCL